MWRFYKDTWIKAFWGWKAEIDSFRIVQISQTAHRNKTKKWKVKVKIAYWGWNERCNILTND